MATSYPLILASASPRRRELLAALGLSFEVDAPGVDETPRPDESAETLAKRVAAEKARAVASRRPGRAVLGADTVVVLDGVLFGKPTGGADAERMLRALSGRTHAVFTAVAVVSPRGTFEAIARTNVRFRVLSPEFIGWYAASREPLDKAGAYAIQGAAGSQVEGIEGSPSNVVGLPVRETVDLLAAAGCALPWGSR